MGKIRLLIQFTIFSFFVFASSMASASLITYVFEAEIGPVNSATGTLTDRFQEGSLISGLYAVDLNQTGKVLGDGSRVLYDFRPAYYSYAIALDGLFFVGQDFDVSITNDGGPSGEDEYAAQFGRVSDSDSYPTFAGIALSQLILGMFENGFGDALDSTELSWLAPEVNDFDNTDSGSITLVDGNPVDGPNFGFFQSQVSLTRLESLAPPIPAVPAPAASWLFGTGLIGLIAFTKRKKLAKPLNR